MAVKINFTSAVLNSSNGSPNCIVQGTMNGKSGEFSISLWAEHRRHDVLCWVDQHKAQRVEISTQDWQTLRTKFDSAVDAVIVAVTEGSAVALIGGDGHSQWITEILVGGKKVTESVKNTAARKLLLDQILLCDLRISGGYGENAIADLQAAIKSINRRVSIENPQTTNFCHSCGQIAKKFGFFGEPICKECGG